MKWELDDNSRGALHYLALGALVMALLFLGDKALTMMSESSTDPALLPFQHGYLLGPGAFVVDATSTRAERVAFGILLAFGLTMFVWVLLALISKLLGGPSEKLTLRAARAVFLIAFTWGAYAAVRIPVRYAEIGKGRAVLLRHRAIFDRVPIPFTAGESTIDEDFAIDWLDSGYSPCGYRLDLVMKGDTADRIHLVTPCDRSGSRNRPAIPQFKEAAMELNKVVEGR